MTADPTIDPARFLDPAQIRELALSTAVEAKGALTALGGDYMSSQAARTAAKDLGMKGWPFYFGGRVGVLGPVAPEVVHAVVGFFPAELAVPSWTTARDPKQSPPLDRVVDRYRDVQRMWADEFLAALPEDEAHELADMLREIATTSETGLSPLAAAWGAMPEPAAARHRVVHWSMVMREQRGGLHITAVQMAGPAPAGGDRHRPARRGRGEVLPLAGAVSRSRTTRRGCSASRPRRSPTSWRRGPTAG